MSIKHKESAALRWAKVGKKERARLGELHRAAMKKWWATVPEEEKSARGLRAALIRHGKVRPLSR